MLIVIIYIVSFITTIIVFRDIKFLLKKEINILLLCNIMFYCVQVLPYFLLNVLHCQDEFVRFPVIYTAITDYNTNLLYCLFILSVSILISVISKKYHQTVSYDFSNIKIALSRSFIILIGVITVLPVFAIFLAPVPSIYFDYSYFYTHSYSPTGAEYIFHRFVMTPLNFVAVISILALYYIKYSKLNKSGYIYILMFLISWLDGKRAIPVMFLFGIIAIDVIKRQKSSKIILKSIIFAIFISIFFVYHSNYTGKVIEDDSQFFVYETYFSRMSCVMTALYDVTHNWEMLDYHGQSVLYTLLFFVPRSLWPDKPIMFCKYYTHYATGIDIENNFNLLVNSWTEYIANFGFIGPLLVIFIFFIISKYSVKSKSQLIFTLGLVFCVFYTVFGFELVANFVVILWVLLYIKASFHINKKRKFSKSLSPHEKIRLR